MKYLKTLLSAVLAGMCIGFGGVVFLALESKVLGAFFFTCGLFCVCTFGLKLFTGKVCYVFQNGKDYVRPGQVVIDVSINWDENKINAKGGKGGIAGDAVYDEVEPIVEAITPVPGGVGTVTTSVLVSHVVEAAEKAAS